MKISNSLSEKLDEHLKCLGSKEGSSLPLTVIMVNGRFDPFASTYGKRNQALKESGWIVIP
jgi:hypothetical protein